MNKKPINATSLFGVRFWRSGGGYHQLEVAAWDPGQQAKHLAHVMHLRLQADGDAFTPTLSDEALPALAIIAGHRVEVYPPLLRALAGVIVMSFPLREDGAKISLLDQITGQTNGYRAKDLPPLTLADLPSALVQGLAMVAGALHGIDLDDGGRARDRADTERLHDETQALWELVQSRVAVMAQNPPTLSIPIPTTKILPGYIRKTIERSMMTIGFEQSRARGELGGQGERYLPGAYARRIAAATQQALRRLDQHEVAVSYTDGNGDPATTIVTILDIKKWSDQQDALYDIARTQRMARLLVADGQAPSMLTVTLPPSWHATPRRDEEREVFGQQSAKDGAAMLQDWFRQGYGVIYKASRKAGRSMCLVRALEPHADGTPHLHIVGGESDLWAMADCIARSYPQEAGQRLCRLVEHRHDDHGCFQTPKRFPTYQTLQDWDSGHPIKMGRVGVAMQIDVFRTSAAEVTERLVQYLTKYVKTGDEGLGAQQDLAEVLNDRSGKPKVAAAQAWHRAAGLTSRKVGWSGLESNKTEWRAVNRKAYAKRTPLALTGVLEQLLTDWAEARGTWEQLKAQHRVSVEINDDGDVSVHAEVATDDGHGQLGHLRLGGRVRESIVERVPDLDRLPKHLEAANQRSTPTEQLAYTEELARSNVNTSPPPAEQQADGRVPGRSVFPALTALTVADVLAAVEGMPYRTLAAPGAGKTTLIVRGLLQWQAIHDHAGETPQTTLLVYRQRDAAMDAAERLQSAGVRAALRVGRQRHDSRASRLMAASDGAPVVIVATVDTLLHGKLRQWSGVVFIDEAQDLHCGQIDRLESLEDAGQIAIGLLIGDNRQALLPDAPPPLMHSWGRPWIDRSLPRSYRCPSVIAEAASAAAADYPPILAAQDGGVFAIETVDTRRDAVEQAARIAVEAFEKGKQVVVQADTHESLHRVRARLRQHFGDARIPDGIDTRTPAGAKGGTWDVSVYLVDLQLGGALVAERPSETAATAITRASQVAQVVTYRIAD